ncbi:Piwi-domain-containing protein [Pleomassaria siparia CBS 279.74]|uniref:Piwi-domain-containing protein n=1 Tax=Pleomassaria siparia CBS 279.74 TaxID=1314801 RepID=A0A6G1K083_9PLEO|nr:Piwi-domain-containing protein [Pleomassaria siparia CBS 279.74]
MADRGRGGRGEFRGRGRGDGGGRGDRGGFRGDRGGGARGGSDRGGGFRGDRGGGGFRGDRGGGGGFRGGDRGGGGGFRGGRGGAPAQFFGHGVFPQPDATTTKIETELVKDLSTAMGHVSTDIVLPQRPGYGKNGKPIVLWTNYFPLKGMDKETSLYRYSVTFEPNEAYPDEQKIPKPTKYRLMQLLLTTPTFAKVITASDWAQMIVTPAKVNLGSQNREAFTIENYHEDEQPLPPAVEGEDPKRTETRRKRTFRLLVQEIGTVSLSELTKDLSQAGVHYSLKLETIQALNIVMSNGPSTDPGITSVGQNKFYPFGSHPQAAVRNLTVGLLAHRGYYSSVRTSVNRILLNVNVATAAFYKAGNLLELLRELRNEQGLNINGFVTGLRIETNYLTQKDANGKVKKAPNGALLTRRSVHTISGLNMNKDADTERFDWTNPQGKTKKVSITEYLRENYQVVLTTPRAPLVNIAKPNSRPIWIPAELCSVLPGQLAKRLLLPDQTRAMIEFAARSPFDNAQSIMQDSLKVTKIAPTLNANLTKFRIHVDPNLLTVPGRILPAPTLQYRTKPCTPNNGAWNLNPKELGAQPFKIAKPLNAWNCLIINSRYDTINGGQQGAMGLLELFRRTLDSYGMRPGPVQQPAFMNVSESDLRNVDSLPRVESMLKETLKKGFKIKPTFLFVILPGDNAMLYDCIKFVCDVQFGIPTICSIGKKLSKEKGQIQYFSNVALKFNKKLGGVNHSIKLDSMAPLDASTIVFGIDVTHPSPGSSEKAPSIAGVVASIDEHFGQYPASIRTQEGKKEMVTDLEEMIIERLKLWQKKNGGKLPNKAIVYRDGVSEGQYRIVMESEYPAFVRAFNKIYGKSDKHPKISIVVVGKRHHTRFYPTKNEDSDGRTGNPKPGTVVDRGVTGEKLFDFFLLAHQGLQGTSKPAHYVVIKDDNKFGADQLQNLTHNLCYTFARATRAVSICPPAYYADLLCERGRCYLHAVLKGQGAGSFTNTSWHRDVHPSLAETMFYL